MERREDAWQRAHGEAKTWLRRHNDAWTREHREDLVQEATLQAWQWSGRMRHRERFWAAVHTITRRVRARAMRAPRMLQTSFEAVAAVPCRDALADETWFRIAGRRVPAPCVLPWLREALARLQAIDRELLLGFYEGFCCIELAERHGRSLPCVKTRLHRARRRIRNEVEACVRAAGGFDD
jgi:DNA-directed RNA polymerase specialized sigma24 family protein